MRETNSYYSFPHWQQNENYNVQGRYPPVQHPYSQSQQPFPFQANFQQFPVQPPYLSNHPSFMNHNGGIPPVNQYEPFYSPMTANHSYGHHLPPNPQAPVKNFGPPFQKAPSNYLLQSFKGENGSMDYQKMMNTAGQFMGTMSQIQSMFKGLGSVFKGV